MIERANQFSSVGVQEKQETNSDIFLIFAEYFSIWYIVKVLYKMSTEGLFFLPTDMWSNIMCDMLSRAFAYIVKSSNLSKLFHIVINSTLILNSLTFKH